MHVENRLFPIFTMRVTGIKMVYNETTFYDFIH